VGCEGTVCCGFMNMLLCLLSYGLRVSGQPFVMLTCIYILITKPTRCTNFSNSFLE